MEFSHPRRVWTRSGAYFKVGSSYGRVEYVSPDGPGFVRVFAKGVGTTPPEDAPKVHDIRGRSDSGPENVEFHQGLEEQLHRNFVPTEPEGGEEPVALLGKRKDHPEVTKEYARGGKLLAQVYKASAVGDESFEQWLDNALTDKDVIEHSAAAVLLTEGGPVGELWGQMAANAEENYVDPVIKETLTDMYEARHAYDEKVSVQKGVTIKDVEH